jgi:circadian clock protein KaiC
MSDKLRSGISGLDALLEGGIPRGRTTLISGKSGAGKTSIAVQMLSTLARKQDLPGIFVCVEERPDDVVAGGDAMGLGTSELVADKRVTLLDLRRPIGERTEFSGDSTLDAMIELIATTAQKSGAKLVVIDSISSLFQPRLASEETRRHILFLVSALEERGFTVVLTADAPSDYSRPTTQGTEDAAVLVLVVRNAVDETRRRRTLEVYKYRRSNHRKGEYPFTISANGVVIFPVELSQSVQDRGEAATSERFSSGLEGLDQMNRGGWLRDSIVLVRGPSGSGKTTLAGMYVRAGAERGERIAYYGFEEPRQVLLRNFAKLGMPLESYANSEDVRVVCRYPEATSAEDLLIEMRHDLDVRKPSLVVVDSISSIEHASSRRGFRDFLIGLASLLRSHNRSALLIQTIGSQAEAGEDAAPYLSTVADAILSLDYTADAPELRRTMRVLKMRGSAHSLDQWSLRIEADGLHVEPGPHTRKG